jgi:RNA polymerase sigma-70 factor (family 1)
MENLKISLCNGDEKEFKALFDTYSKRLYDIACRHVLSADAQDILQELFIEIWEKRDTIKVRTSWEGYLYSILKYRIYRFLDRRNELDQSFTEAMNEIGSQDDILGFEQLYCKLDKTVNSLPPQCRTIFEKKYYQNKKLQEIADEMNISTETVKTQLKRGLKIMRLQMKDAMANFMFL